MSCVNEALKPVGGSQMKRNCDVYESYDEANKAWFDWSGTPDGMNSDGTVKLTFGEWCFAPAAEIEK